MSFQELTTTFPLLSSQKHSDILQSERLKLDRDQKENVCAFGKAGPDAPQTSRRMPPVSEMETPGSDEGLSRAECLCPVCLEIFMEPVTLPCHHSFCKPCFLETVDKANMCCPLCRKRVSTWARLNSRKKTLVNEELWLQVQATFPVQCQRRLSGQEEEEENILVPRPKVSLPGEVRREYEDQISKHAEENRALEEAERKASEEYIQHLLAEEEERQAEARRRDEERQLENDEKLAKLLSQELNPSPISESRKNQLPNDTPAKKKMNTNVGDIERFLSPIPQRHSNVSDKENILHMETNRRSSEDPTECPMPNFCGRPEKCSTLGKATTSLEGMMPHLSDATGISMAQELSHVTPAKRKSCVVESNEGDAVSKRSCPSLSSFDHPPCELAELVGDATLLQELAQREAELFSRCHQEEKDRQMALQLQKELNREEALRAVDRRKGSTDQYQLRQKPGSSLEQNRSSKTRRSKSCSFTHNEHRVPVKKRSSEPSSTVTRRESSSTSAASAAVSSNLPRKVSKQATLTEMFHGLGN
ncbi:hypothetical protein DPEC_G00242340 [Dallia pectoralis]|uniref:Uncharacterized protein n=1 Tax=Dallia pectoralis TaxID=75939 RepID=A0ACC2FV81_DALPE|nr:hypothetical protein DPEC_G00242340 [Dallia pectoralis]